MAAPPSLDSAISIEKWKKHPLPIDEKLSQIFTLLNDKEHRVVVLKAEPGAGKTTRIAPAYIFANPERHCVLTQTRRTACSWNAKYIASELGCSLGELVGLSLYGEKKKVSDKTRLELLIDQSLVNRIQHQQELPKDLIIVDEADERTIPIDLLLGLIKQALPRSPDTRLLVTSSTIDTAKLAKYFGSAPVIHVQGRCYPVLTEIWPLQHGEHHTQGAIRAACTVFKRFLQGNLVVSEGQKIGIKKGTVLILLPGKEDISSTIRALSEEASRSGTQDQIKLLSCSGESSAEERDRVQEPVPENTLCFVCGTEVLRRSVTVPEAIGVIDSLQHKRLSTDTKGVAHLGKEAISKAEADQGKGRAGRTGPGFYMPVSFGSEYHTLREWPMPAILREPVMRIALQIAAVGHSIRTFDFIDPPPPEKVEVAISRLKALGALTADEKITDEGRLLLKFPLDPERAKALLSANSLGVLAEAVIVTAVLEIEGIFHSVDHNEEARKAWAAEGKSDFAAIVRSFRAFKTEERKSHYKVRDQRMREWCIANGLNFKRMRLAEETIRQISEEIHASPLKLNQKELTLERPFDEAALTKALISGMFDNIAKSSRGQFSGRIGDFKLAVESICPQDSELLLVGGVCKIAYTRARGQTAHFQLASHAAPIEAAWILEKMPHLCTKKQLDQQYHLDQDCVLVTEVTYFQDDFELQRIQIKPDAVSSAKTFALWLVHQSLSTYFPPSLQLFHQVFQENANIQSRAQRLNYRAGKTLFKVFSTQELYERFLRALAGAQSLSQVSDPHVLALPALDKVLVSQVLKSLEPPPLSPPPPRSAPADKSSCILM